MRTGTPAVLAGRDLKRPVADARETLARQVARNLDRRYRLVLTLIALLIAVDAGVIEPALVHLNAFAPVINLAGRQRMLSQKLTKTALAINRSAVNLDPDLRHHAGELRLALAEWSLAHATLQNGSPPAIAAAINQLQSDFVAICAAAAQLLESAESVPASSAVASPQLRVILARESDYLRQMEAIVGMFEADARREIAWLRFTSWSVKLSIVGLIATLGLVVLRPATRTIHQQVEELESRVAERTRQLSDANASLADEIQERQQAETRTRQLSEQLAHASRVTTIGELATGLAHELNQPLGAITNFAECCELMVTDAQPESETLRQTLGRIVRAALRASDIIRRLQRFVRKQPLERVPLEPLGLLEDVRELCRHELQRQGVELNIVCTLGVPVVTGDAVQLQQVLLNLIQNGMDALRDRPNGQRLITIGLGAVDGELQVDVADSGLGFAGADVEAIFNPFVTTKARGLGMGLAISRSIIHEHGGRMWAAAAPQGGAMVSFTLPRAFPDPLRENARQAGFAGEREAAMTLSSFSP